MSSIQAKVSVVVHVAALVAQLVAETTLYDIIPPEAKQVRGRFWGQYLVGLVISVVTAYVLHKGTDCLAKAGHSNLAWISVFVPIIPIVATSFLLHGVDAVLAGSSGTDSVKLIVAARKSRKANKKNK